MKENKRKRVKCGRSPASDPNTTLFRFPIPGLKNSFRCESWAKFCFPEKEWFSTESKKKKYSDHRMLCNRHFKSSSFSNWPESTKKLHKYAVPDESTDGEEITVTCQNEPGPSCSGRREILVDTTNLTQGVAVKRQASEMKGDQKRPKLDPGAGTSSCDIKQCVQSLPDTTSMAVSAVAGPSNPKIQKPTKPIVEAEPTIQNLIPCTDLSKDRDKFKKQYLKCRKHMKKICRLRKQIRKLKNKSGQLLSELNESASVQALMKKLTPTFALLLQSQIKNLKRKAKGRRWTQQEKITALRLFKRSPTCYRLMRRLFCLPAPSTLRALLKKFDLHVGINSPIFQVLKKIVSRQKPSDNEFILMFDEMSIRKNIIYNPKTDKIEGYQDHGKQGRSREVASHALVFMIGGIRKKVKQPVAFYLSSSFVTADRLAVLIKEVLQACFEAGLIISATVCDMDGVKRRALSILGASSDTPYFTLEQKEITCMFDTPHLLKCFRNVLMKHNIKTKTQIRSNEITGIGVAKWSHIKQFYELDNNNPNFVFAPSLRQEHLEPNSKQKMKVNLAAQVLSHTVAAGMLARIAEGTLTSEAAVTAEVLEIMDKLFDSLNSDSQDLRRGKVFATNIKQTTPHLQLFKEMKKKLSTLEVVGSRQKPPPIDGWIWTLNAVERLWRELTKKHPAIESLATRRLQQNPLENLFGCVRANCGSNSNPTSVQFVAALKTAILSKMAHLGTGNCENDNLDPVIDNYKTLLSKSYIDAGSTMKDQGSHVAAIEDTNCSDIDCVADMGELQDCAYVCGFLLKNIEENVLNALLFY